MIQLYYPERDTTIYERFPDKNTGIDQMLELIKVASGSLLDGNIQADTYNSRILIDFGNQITAIADAINAGDIPPIGSLTVGSASVYLTMKVAYASDLPYSYTLYAHPLYEAWTNGTGNYNDIPETRNGASWYYTNNGTQATRWATGSAPSYNDFSVTNTLGGGAWYTGSGYQATQTFEGGTDATIDMRMNVTDIVKKWIDGTITDHGFIIKRSRTDERSGEIMGTLKFFGLDTHTIYVPRLEVAWNDTVTTGTGSKAEIADDIYVPYIKNIRNEYREVDKAIFRIAARPQYPQRSYTTSSHYTTEYRLPTSSYYSIQDAVTNETIIPFDIDATKISCDSNGSYFRLRLNTFQPERYYKVVLKVERSGGDDIQTFSDGFYFKVVR
jgi:hypothetical protein